MTIPKYKPPEQILALDPATKTGWAHSNQISGVWDLSVRRDESSGMRLARLHGKLAQLLEATPYQIVAYEAARHAAPKMQGALVVQAQLQGVIVYFCEANKIEYRGYSPSEIKKHATGKGNANKTAMIQAARERFNPPGELDDNQADALWILDLAKTDLKIR